MATEGAEGVTPQKSNEVVKIKAAVRERDGHRCTECGMTNGRHKQIFGRALDVHRVVPGSVYSVAPGVCVTLCKDCHYGKPVSRPNSRKKKRKAVLLPAEWADLIADMARKDHRPITWQLIIAIREHAIAAGMQNMPVEPWKMD